MIQSGATVALLAHLRRGSITVARGERVRTGQLQGAVGNSGNSLVPHLHFEILDGPDPLTAQRLPFRVRAYDRWTGNAWERVEHGVLRAGERVRYLNRAARTANTLASAAVERSVPYHQPPRIRIGTVYPPNDASASTRTP